MEQIMAYQDSDSTLIRGQQDKDTLEHIALDETRGPADRSDSDTQSRRERESAKAGIAPNGQEQMASIFEQNGGSDGDKSVEPDKGSSPADADEGLAQRGRSLLGE
ncbi:hypothetical protein [Aurantimonas endophytica]|uniref:Uncharacterized protein n=2 Tax=Aurantimonas endophytica TaxID=1522175 RepID=A0A7W6HCM9_9HYPH|nr:hypothetical protein [Aurantimonas endophytica]MBB4002726.1 hypothetical protein [Aurantimonas endophytica]MCO6403605.1 hypothetical protein [Aurantimonas endophytica]